jgi:hypothetical protein
MSRGHLAAAVAAFALALALPAAARADSFPLMGWWPMNEGSGQVVHDWSGHGNNGYLGSTPAADANDPTWVKGVFLGSALHFDGNDMVSIPNSPSLQPANLTVAAWVRSTGTPGLFKYILAKGATADCDHSSYGLYTSTDGGLAFYVSDSSRFYVSPQSDLSVWDGNWHNVAGTFDGHSVRLYVDGMQVGSGTPAATTIDYTNPGGGGFLGDFGGTACTGPLNMSGDIDGVQVWSQALPVDTIWRALKSLFTLSR